MSGRLGAFLRRLSLLFRRPQLDRDLDDELRFHLELSAEAARSLGASAEEAARQARLRLGPLARVREEARAALGFPRTEALWRDVVLAVRRLRRVPGFALAAAGTVAIGIGASAALFAIVDAVLLRSLPYPEPERIVSLLEYEDGQRTSVAPANLADYRVPAIESLAAWHFVEMDLSGTGRADALSGEAVGAEFFAALGIGPRLGRPFLPEEDRDGGERVVILSDALWRSRFAADPLLVGKTIRLDREPHRVVGVLPAGFVTPGGARTAQALDFLVPAAFAAPLLQNRGDHETNVVARLQPGVRLEDARAQLAEVSARLARAYPDSNRSLRAEAVPVDRDVTRDVRGSLLLLLAAVGVVLAISCLNVANLHVVRALGRQRELAISSALGAARGRLASGLLVESLLLALAGGGAGVLLAHALLAGLKALAPVNTPRLAEAGLDARVLLVALAASVATGLVFGALPAWHASRARPADLLRAGEAHQASRSVLRWRGILLSAEVALALVLLASATLVVRSIARLNAVELGFETRRIVAAQVKLPEAQYRTPQERLSFFEQLERRLAADPGVEGVAFANRLPLRGGWSTGITTDTQSSADAAVDADAQAVSPGYFRTLAIPLLRGRGFEPGDREGAPPVAVVNEEFARRFFAGLEPLGHRVRRGTQAPWVTVVGVVGSLRRDGSAAERLPGIYYPAAQTSLYPVRLADVAVRAEASAGGLVAMVRTEVARLDPEQPVSRVATLDEALARGLAPRRFGLALLGGFAVIALALTLVGVHGVAAYSVEQRTPELGLRIALGAEHGRILGLVIRDVMLRVAAGVALGLALAIAVTRALRGFLFEVAPTDPGSLLAAVVLMSFAGLLASFAPALRATRIDPMRALRLE